MGTHVCAPAYMFQGSLGGLATQAMPDGQEKGSGFCGTLCGWRGSRDSWVPEGLVMELDPRPEVQLPA